MSQPWPEVAVILITRNAADVLGGALDSVPAGAEIVVADDRSDDGTPDLARRRGARVIPQDPERLAAANGNFDIARNDAARHATRPWWFFLDADERISPALADEVAARLPQEACAAFDMPRINRFWGRPVRLLGEDRQTRLVRRGLGRFPDGPLHQKMVIEGRIDRLAAPLIHENIRNWRDVRLRFERYVPVEARQLPFVPARRVATEGLGHFVYYYRDQGAWRDGALGLMVSLIYAAYRVAVLREARRRASHA